MKETDELVTQQRIYNMIIQHPGLYLSQIAQLCKINIPLLLYHLRVLQKHNLISMVKEKGFTRCYVKGELGVEEKKLLSILRQDIPLRIVIYLLKHPSARHKELLKLFDIAKSTLSYHIKKLIDNEIINAQSFGEEQGYVVIDEEKIIRILIKYKPSRIALGLKDTWIDFTAQKKERKKNDEGQRTWRD